MADRVDTQFVGTAGVGGGAASRRSQPVTGADELVVTTITHDHADRVRSHELLADAVARRCAPQPRQGALAMSGPRKQVHLAAHFPGVNNTTVWSDPTSGSQIDFASFVHLAQTAERGKFDFFFLAEGLRLREHRGRIFDLDVVGRPDSLDRARRRSPRSPTTSAWRPRSTPPSTSPTSWPASSRPSTTSATAGRPGTR